MLYLTLLLASNTTDGQSCDLFRMLKREGAFIYSYNQWKYYEASALKKKNLEFYKIKIIWGTIYG